MAAQKTAQRSGRGRSRGPDEVLLACGPELGGHCGERVLHLASEGVDDRDDGNRNAGGDEAVLDGGRAAFIAQKIPIGGHVLLPWVSANIRRNRAIMAESHKDK